MVKIARRHHRVAARPEVRADGSGETKIPAACPDLERAGLAEGQLGCRPS